MGDVGNHMTDSKNSSDTACPTSGKITRRIRIPATIRHKGGSVGVVLEPGWGGEVWGGEERSGEEKFGEERTGEERSGVGAHSVNRNWLLSKRAFASLQGLRSWPV